MGLTAHSLNTEKGLPNREVKGNFKTVNGNLKTSKAVEAFLLQRA